MIHLNLGFAIHSLFLLVKFCEFVLYTCKFVLKILYTQNCFDKLNSIIARTAGQITFLKNKFKNFISNV